MAKATEVNEIHFAAVALIESWGDAVSVIDTWSLDPVLKKYAADRVYTRGRTLYSHLVNAEGDLTLKPPGRGKPAHLLDKFLAATTQLAFGGDLSARMEFMDVATAYYRRTGRRIQYDEGLTARENIRRVIAADLQTVMAPS